MGFTTTRRLLHKTASAKRRLLRDLLSYVALRGVCLCCRASVRVVLCNGVGAYGSLWEDSGGRDEAASSAPYSLSPGSGSSSACPACVAQLPLPLPPRTPPRAACDTPLSNSMTASTTDHLLGLSVWRELCRAPASPPSFDQRTTRRLPRLWRFLFLVGFPCATPPRPRFFVACRLLCP